MRKHKQSEIQTHELSTLEAQLAGTLRPVKPSEDLVDRLRKRIRFPERAELMRRLNNWRSLFLALGGVFSGMLLLITIARALYHLVGRRG
jgi:hypothetical protein